MIYNKLTMLSLLKDVYNQTKNIKGRKLLYIFIVVFISFLIIGITIGYITNRKLTKNELEETNNTYMNNSKTPKLFDGKVVYIGDLDYPEEDIVYVLNDISGKRVILLKSEDKKLVIAEGLYVTVKGKVQKTKNTNEDVLVVEEVIINNVSN